MSTYSREHHRLLYISIYMQLDCLFQTFTFDNESAGILVVRCGIAVVQCSGSIRDNYPVPHGPTGLEFVPLWSRRC